MNQAETVAVCKREVEQALGYDSDILATKRQKALDYYHGNVDPAPEGRNSIVSKDVADTVHALLSQTQRIFQTSLIAFPPVSEEDEPQAQMESDFCRWIFERSNGYKILGECSHDAYLIGNGWLKVVIEEEDKTSRERYRKDIDNVQVGLLADPRAPNETVDVSEKDEYYEVTRTVTERKLRVRCVSPDYMLFSASNGQMDLDQLTMVGERVLYKVADLVELGLSEEEARKIPDYESDYWPAARARDGIYQNESGREQSAQDSEKLKECFDIHIHIDQGGGKSELRNIIYGGSTLIQDEPAECQPYCTGSPIPMPHRVQGTGMFEIMASVQEGKTTVLREYMDNLGVMNKSRVWAVEGDANLADLTSAKLNGVVRVRHGQAIGPLPGTDIGPEAITGLNYLDTVRGQRGGAAVDLNESDRQIMASSATAAAGMMESAERMAGWYARNITETLLGSAFKLIHRKLRKQMPGQVSANLRGEWIQTDPAEWPQRETIEITAGMTTSERTQKILGLSQLITNQYAVMQQGGDGIITNKEKIYSAMADWIRANELGNPEEYLVNPTSKEAQQAQQQQAQQAQQQQQQIQQQQQALIEQQAQMQAMIEKQKQDFERWKHKTELDYKYYDANLDAEIKEAEMTVDGAIKLETGKNEAVQ